MSKYIIPLIILILSACSNAPKSNTPQNISKTEWQGKLALKINTTPPQNFFTNFDIKGNETAGQMQLYSPFGTTIAKIKWQNNIAQLIDGKNTKTYPNISTLINELTGAPIPIEIIFKWLNGQQITPPENWKITSLNNYKLTAKRQNINPEIDLNIIIEQE